MEYDFKKQYILYLESMGLEERQLSKRENKLFYHTFMSGCLKTVLMQISLAHMEEHEGLRLYQYMLEQLSKYFGVKLNDIVANKSNLFH